MTARAFEIWGGIECTVNRVHDRQCRQLQRNGHLVRIESDLDAFASLGVTSIRYPVLWEDVEQPDGALDFASADRAMEHFPKTGMAPIVGLVHHGSGPMSTCLTSDDFAERFARYAGAVARRYPGVVDYTPINEPVTTARFSGLYGHWYPHARDDRAFVRMLLTQTRATILAMRAIRAVTPTARLVQTDDLGRAGGTARVRDQVQFENERRWVGFDLLAGRVTPHHPLFEYLVTAGGASAAELDWFTQHPCPADVIGVNHYPRSNRWLDDRLDLYPPRYAGGNGVLRYADVAACDTSRAETPSLSSILCEASDRYRAPVALTEVHVAGEASDQIAWWNHAVASAVVAAAQGVSIEAVTSWSLLGSFDWDELCTTAGDGVTYENGAFDVSSGERVETALAGAIRATAHERARAEAA